MKTYALTLLLVLFTACSSAPIVPRRPIEVPPNVSKQQVEIAIVSALADIPAAQLTWTTPSPSHGEETSLGSLFEQAYSGDAQRTRRGWRPDSYRPGSIVATYYRGRRHLRVGIRYNQYQITTQILGSERLEQHDGHIHENALVWLSQLETKIHHTLKSMAFLESPEVDG